MKNTQCLLALILSLYSCSSSNRSSESQGATEAPEEITIATSILVADAIEENDAATAYDLLINNEFNDGKLKLSEDIILWYKNDPNFNSWFVSKSLIQEGPSYFYKIKLVIKDLTTEVLGDELLIYAGHSPYTYVDAYALTDGQDKLAVKILETVFNGSGNDRVLTMKPAPNEPNLGITDEFEIKMDEYDILSFDSQEIDLSHIIGNRYFALFSLPSYEETRWVEPACLSDAPNIDFSGINDNFLRLACGQDMLQYPISNLSKEADRLVFFLDDRYTNQEELKLEVLQLDSTTENPFKHIEISLSDFSSLYMGYYDDSITSINSDKLVMMLHNKENAKLLRSLDRWTAVPCPEDMFDEY